MASLRQAAEQAWLAQRQQATDTARVSLGRVLDPFDVSTLAVADVQVGDGYRLVVFTDGEVHVAVREPEMPEEAPEVFLVHADGDQWVIDAPVTSLVGLHEVLPPAPSVPSWEPGITVSAGERYSYEGQVYEVIQGHTTQASWTPDITPALWMAVM